MNNPKVDAAGDWILDWIVPLHDGKAFGMAGRIIVMILGRETGARTRKELATQV